MALSAVCAFDSSASDFSYISFWLIAPATAGAEVNNGFASSSCTLTGGTSGTGAAAAAGAGVGAGVAGAAGAEVDVTGGVEAEGGATMVGGGGNGVELVGDGDGVTAGVGVTAASAGLLPLTAESPVANDGGVGKVSPSPRASPPSTPITPIIKAHNKPFIRFSKLYVLFYFLDAFDS